MHFPKMLNPLMLGRTQAILRTLINNRSRTVFTSSVRLFHEEWRSGYPDKYDVKDADKPKTEQERLRENVNMWKEQFSMLWEETKTFLSCNPRVVYRQDEIDIEWRFQGDPKILDQFVVSMDSDFNEGNSKASIQLTKTGRGIFSGFVDTTPPTDGMRKRSGYCNLRTVAPRKSFYRKAYIDWENYTHLVMRVRGDGRNYLLILGCPGDFDLYWNDTYQYILYTRGGPYWQDVRIPFSKFFFVSKGRIQDIQQPPLLSELSTVSITVAKVHGNFKLEIDYIGVECDHSHEEQHAYEMYRPPHKFAV